MAEIPVSLGNMPSWPLASSQGQPLVFRDVAAQFIPFYFQSDPTAKKPEEETDSEDDSGKPLLKQLNLQVHPGVQTSGLGDGTTLDLRGGSQALSFTVEGQSFNIAQYSGAESGVLTLHVYLPVYV